MDDRTFGALLHLFMCSDPWPCSPEEHTVIEAFLNEESVKRGFSGWIEAFHRVP